MLLGFAGAGNQPWFGGVEPHSLDSELSSLLGELAPCGAAPLQQERAPGGELVPRRGGRPCRQKDLCTHRVRDALGCEPVLTQGPHVPSSGFELERRALLQLGRVLLLDDERGVRLEELGSLRGVLNLDEAAAAALAEGARRARLCAAVAALSVGRGRFAAVARQDARRLAR